LKLVSWNVNGLRAVLRRNFLAYLAEEKPDVVCLQEVRAEPHEVEPLWPAEYETFWNPAQKKGSGNTLSGSPPASACLSTMPKGGY
jgi:exodeoxyribonuclease-3